MKYDLVGRKFNKLSVLEKSEKRIGGRVYWKCKCDCGNETNVETSKLTTGWTKSCGCLYKDDLINLKFGKLTVIQFKGIIDNHANWNCLCECGNSTILRTNVLKNGHTKSCGCSHSAGKNNCNWRGVGDISGNYWNRIVKRAKKDKKSFDITKEYIWDIFISQGGKCALSGLELKFESKQGEFDGTASLDRIDSSKGYEKGNVQWIHKDINWMKLDFDQSYFIKLCKTISSNIV